METVEIIKAFQRKHGLLADGVAGPKVWAKVREIDNLAVSETSNVQRPTFNVELKTPQAAIDLILEAEGIDQPSKWPGGESGITLGYGYDLGYEEHFARDWDGILTAGEIERLKVALGKTGTAARQLALRFQDIRVAKESALAVFLGRTLPHYEAETRHAFPGVELLSPNVFGALVSLVFNRGSGMVGERRSEMRAIREAVKRGDVPEIARQFRSMKRLWQGAGLDGLIRRRENEARLVDTV